jgi:ribonuclease HI
MTKFYVVFRGRKAGVYATWEECRSQIEGVPGHSCKAYKSRCDAEDALRAGSARAFEATRKERAAQVWRSKIPGACIAVDAACAGVPGPTEYRGVLLPECSEIFHSQLYARGTNNVGEFLAIVEGMRWLAERSFTSLPLYSDSQVGLGWVRAGKCNTHMASASPDLKMAIEAADSWLRASPEAPKLVPMLRKWPTSEFGEIPADFGRK